MAYNRKGYFRRAIAIKELAEQYYEPERHDRCWKAVWRRHIYPRYGICYDTFLTYLQEARKAETSCIESKEQMLPLLFS